MKGHFNISGELAIKCKRIENFKRQVSGDLTLGFLNNILYYLSVKFNVGEDSVNSPCFTEHGSKRQSKSNR